MFTIGQGISIGQGITITYEYPAAPTNTVLPVISGTVQVRVTISCGTGTWIPGVPSPILGYYYQWQASDVDIPGATSNTYEIGSAYVGETIRCQVTAYNAFGDTSVFTIETPAAIPNTPGAPINVIATNDVGYGSARVSFDPPINDGGSAITSYTASSDPGIHYNSNSTSPIIISGLTIGSTYSFTVYATNSQGNGLPATSNSITISIGLSYLSTVAIGALYGINESNDQTKIFVYTGAKIYSLLPDSVTGELTLDKTNTAIGTYTPLLSNPNVNVLYAGGKSWSYDFDGNTTLLAGTFSSPANPASLFIDPNGLYLYRASASGADIGVIRYTLDSSGYITGATSTYSVNIGGGSSFQIKCACMSPDRKTIYVMGQGTIFGTPATVLRGLKYDTGTSSWIYNNLVNETYLNPTYIPVQVVVSPDNTSINISLSNGTTASQFLIYTRNTTSGQPGSAQTLSFSGITSALSPAFTSDGNFVFLPNAFYDRNTTTGYLTLNTSSGFSPNVITYIAKSDLNIYAGSDTGPYATGVATYRIT